MKLILCNSNQVFKVQRPKQAVDYVNDFAKKVTLTAQQKTALTSFVQTSMDADVWGSVSRCFPMLGNAVGCKYDLKSLSEDFVVPTSCSYDSTRNALMCEAKGLNSGTTEIPFNNSNGTFIVSSKIKLPQGNSSVAAGKGRRPIYSMYKYNTWYNNGIDLGCVTGGYVRPNAKVRGYTDVSSVVGTTSSLPGYNVSANTRHIYSLRVDGQKQKFDCLQQGATAFDAIESDIESSFEASQTAKFVAGGFYAAAQTGDTPVTDGEFYGTINMILAINKRLSDSQTETILRAIETLNESLGRNVDF